MVLLFLPFKARMVKKCAVAHSFTSLCVGTALFSRAASSQVFSALMSLTSVFGMGTGGPSPPLAPTSYATACRRRYI